MLIVLLIAFALSTLCLVGTGTILYKKLKPVYRKAMQATSVAVVVVSVSL